MTVISVSHIWAAALLSVLVASPPIIQACIQPCSCPGSEEVFCTFSQLTSIPPAIPRQTRRLNLGYNDIEALNGSEFKGLRRLEMLMLHGNEIQSLSSRAFYNLRALWILKLSHNKLRSITCGIFEGLSSLRRLLLDHNTIEFIEPFSFSGLTSLSLLNLEGNQLKDLHPHTFVTLSFLRQFWGSSLRYLHLSDNLLAHLLPGTLQVLNKLEALSIYGNPWACDCHLQWLLQWSYKNTGVIKCQKEGELSSSVNCAMCSSPQALNNSQIFQLSTSQLSCDKPNLHSPLKLWDSSVWLDNDSEIPFIEDLEPSLGNLTLTLSDSRTSTAHADCVVKRQGSTLSWQNQRFLRLVAVNVTFMGLLECEINSEDLRTLWGLVAKYYERPAILNQGPRQDSVSRATFHYSQAFSGDSSLFTGLKGYLSAEPEWLLQPRVTLQLNRRKTTGDILVLNFSTFLSKQIRVWGEQRAKFRWAFLHRGEPGKVKTALEGSDVSLSCNVSRSGDVFIQWILPDLSILTTSQARVLIPQEDKLVIHKASPRDSGLYHCLVRSEVDVDMVSFRVFVKERQLSSDLINGRKMSLNYGESLILPCSSSSVEPSDMAWYLPSNIILRPSSPEGRIKVTSDGSLVIMNVTYMDNGVYSCLAINLFGVDMLSHQVVIRRKINPLSAGAADNEPKRGAAPENEQNTADEGSGFSETEYPHMPGGHDRFSVYFHQVSSKVDTDSKSVNSRHKLHSVTGRPIKIQLSSSSHTGEFMNKYDKNDQSETQAGFYSNSSTRMEDYELSTEMTGLTKTVELDKQDRKQLNINQDHLLSPFGKAERNSSETSTTADYLPQFNGGRVKGGPGFSTDSPSETTAVRPVLSRTALQVPNVTPHPLAISQGQTPEYALCTEKGAVLKKSSRTLSKIAESYETLKYGDDQLREKLKANRSNADILQTVTAGHIYPKVRAINPWVWQPHIQDTVMVFPTARPHSNPVSTPNVAWQEHTSSKISRNIFSSEGPDIGVTGPQRNIFPSALTSRPTFPEGRAPTPSTLQPPHIRPSSNIKDFAWISRLRNRYRQHKLDFYHLAQAGEIIKSKSSVKFLNPIPQPTITTPVYSQLATNETNSSIPYDSPRLDGHQGSQKLYSIIPTQKLIKTGRKPKISALNTVRFSAPVESDIFLPCESSGEPKPTHSWTKVSTGATMEEGTKNGERFEVLGNGTFVIRNVQVQDRGQYRCTARNVFGSNQQIITLSVMTKPPKIVHPKSKLMLAYLGHPINLECKAEGVPQAQISWILPNGKIIRPGGLQDNTVSVLTNGTLRVEVAHMSSKGQYKCIASSTVGTDTMNYQVDVVDSAPTITEEAFEAMALPTGSDGYLYCTARGEPMPKIQWTILDKKKHVTLPLVGGRISLFSNGTLYIRNITLTDSGVYQCSATSQAGNTKRVVQVVVKAMNSSPAQPLLQQHRITGIYGSTLYLRCSGSAASQDGVLWRLPTGVFLHHGNSSNGSNTVFSNGTLRIQQLSEMHTGSYLCLFSTPHGHDVEPFQVEVPVSKPTIKPFASVHRRVALGDSFQMDCLASGSPAPEVSWTLPDGRVVSSLSQKVKGIVSPRLIVFENGTLHLKQTRKGDEGEHTCNAKNKYGHDLMKVRIHLLPESPKILSKEEKAIWGLLGQPVRIKCQATGEPMPAITWVSPSNATITPSSIRYQIWGDGTLVIRKLDLADRGNYICVAKSISGYDVKTVLLEVEGARPQINRQVGRTVAKFSAVLHQILFLDCEAESHPEPRVTWTTPFGICLPAPYLGGRFQVYRNGSLKLHALRKTDAGRYICQAWNSVGEARREIDLEVIDLTEKPSFPKSNTEIVSFKPGSAEVQLRCHATGKPMPEYVWMLPNSTVLIAGTKLQRFHHIPDNGILHVLWPGSGDMGVYHCLANNTAGQAKKQFFLEPGWKPQIQSKPTAVSVSFGQNVNLSCVANAWPQATISWTLPSKHILKKPQVIGRVAYLGSGSLEIREAAIPDRGTYICKATNAFGSAMLLHTVTVTAYPPRITNSFPSVTVVNKGTAAKLTCRAVGEPKPKILWTEPGGTSLSRNSPVMAPNGMHVTAEGSLVIQNPKLTNSGMYKCNATSATGNDYKVTYLQVL